MKLLSTLGLVNVVCCKFYNKSLNHVNPEPTMLHTKFYFKSSSKITFTLLAQTFQFSFSL